MSPAASPRPRLACRIVRAWAACTEATPRHALACEACQRHFAALAALDLRLQADVRAARPPAGLERGILRAVAAATAEPQPVSARAAGARLLMAAGAAGLAALAVLAYLRTPRAGSPAADPAIAADVEQIVDAAQSLRERWWYSVLPSATEAVQNNALAEELASVTESARSAVDFFALNFLPASALEAPPAAPAPASTGKS